MGLQKGLSGFTIYEAYSTPVRATVESRAPLRKVEMRNRVRLSMVVLFALASWAQQTNSNSASGAASPSASQASSDREPLESPRPKDFWDGDDPNLVNLVTHPWANKKYVERQVAPIRDRINELE